MVEDMELRGFSCRTQDSYVRSMTGLAKYYDRSPDLITPEELRRYFVYLTCERELARPTVTIALYCETCRLSSADLCLWASYQ